jgi:non-heme Fe2+,alpha-ketoglutarate-dependent halogenase
MSEKATTTKSLSPEQVSAFYRDGYVFPKQVLSSAEITKYRGDLQSLSDHMGKLKRFDQCHLFFRWAYDLAIHPKVLDVIEDIIGPDILIHSTRIFYKHPYDPSYVSWHVDGRYSGLNDQRTPTAWIALSESFVENGCLRVVRGSHRLESYPYVERPSHDNLENHGQEIMVPIDESEIVCMTLKTGEMSIHDVNIIHGSEANRSDMPRIGFSISYITPEPRSSILPVVHARGSADCSHLPLVEKIPNFEIEEGVVAHREFIQKRKLQQPRLG